MGGHQYLFKLSSKRYPAQYWAEIVAYRMGCLIEVPVPPAFVAFRGKYCGTLIEWFYKSPPAWTGRYAPAGDFFHKLIEGFDRKKGSQHNLHHAIVLCRSLERIKFFSLTTDWKSWFVKMLLFDALIGNTDRHQDNWGFLFETAKEGLINISLSPYFDNGTSLGHEIMEDKISGKLNPGLLHAYICKGRHHMRWSLEEDRISMVSFLGKLRTVFPALDSIAAQMLSFSMDAVDEFLGELVNFNVQVPLTRQRADWIRNLIQARQKALCNDLKV
jgi:hypothetical protein